ncbi:MAG: curli assembly protein CsgF [Pseudomonadota bacterium]
MKLGTLAAGALFLACGATAQELVYEPTNPSFGGNPFNSSHLLGLANAQNDFEAPQEEIEEETQAELFIRQLESRLLSGLANQVTEAIFGENPQESGVIAFDDQVIEFQRGLDTITITVLDVGTGTTTEIVLPVFTTG